MRKLCIIILCAGIICGCSDKTENQSEAVTETTTTTETQTEPETATAVVTTTKAPEPTTAPEPSGKLKYTVTENGIDLQMDGKAVQSIELGYSPYEDYISAADFDFDGYKDIFIPFEGTYREGFYYRYNPDTEQFESWDKLNEIGYVMEIDGNDTLLLKMYSMTGDKCITYKWKNGDISPVLLRNYYFTSDGATNDFYEYAPDGSMILFERQLINPGKSAVYKTYNRDELVYFSAKENGIDVLRDGELLQTIEGDYFGVLDLAARRVRSEKPMKTVEYLDEYGFYVPEDMLETTDFDFDGYFDLFIPTNELLTEGVYYRFDPETERFEKWDELNKIGAALYLGKSEETLIWYNSNPDSNGYETSTYKWENENLVLDSREFTYKGEDGEKYTDYYDSSNTLVKRIHIFEYENGQPSKWVEVEID